MSFVKPDAERKRETERKTFFLPSSGEKMKRKRKKEGKTYFHPRFLAENKINLLLLQRLKSTKPADEHMPRSSASVHQR